VTSTRRSFLKSGALAGAGLAIWVEFPGAVAEVNAAPFRPNAYISITPTNQIRIWLTRSEMGQGIRTTLPMMLLEELEVDWSQVQFEQAMPGGLFKGIRLRTSGSGSTVGTYTALRKAGATAREMLVAAAAEKWQADASTCRAKSAAVIHLPTGRHFTYGELASAASQQKVPDNPPLKNPKDFHIIGTRVKRSRRPASGYVVCGHGAMSVDWRHAGKLRCQ
jgi:isoquinoline 1-oxidoreductase beta subunit